ncbi:MAG: choline dehydrogenase, partial [Rubritalea sp.]
HITARGLADQFDYIICFRLVGCLHARQLAVCKSGPQGAVTRGGGKNLSPCSHIPVGYFKTMHNPAFDECYTAEPDLSIANR